MHKSGLLETPPTPSALAAVTHVREDTGTCMDTVECPTVMGLS